MPINDDVRAAREALLEQGRAAMEDARRPLLAAVGAGELAVTGLRAQLREWPAGTHEQVRRLSTRAGELADRVRELDPAGVRANMGTYLAQARSVYESLAERGEQVMTRRAPQPEPDPARSQPAQLGGARSDAAPDAAPDTTGDAAAGTDPGGTADDPS